MANSPDPLKPIVRTSLSTDLAQKYKAGGGFGLNAATAGGPDPATTNFMDQAHQYQTEFTSFEQGTTYTANALNYATTKYGIDTTPYGSQAFPI
jgi:hypothetical protein